MWLFVILVVVLAAFLALCVAWVRAGRRSQRLVRLFRSATIEEQEWLRQKTQGTELGFYLLPVAKWEVVACFAGITTLLVYLAASKL